MSANLQGIVAKKFSKIFPFVFFQKIQRKKLSKKNRKLFIFVVSVIHNFVLYITHFILSEITRQINNTKLREANPIN